MGCFHGPEGPCSLRLRNVIDFHPGNPCLRIDPFDFAQGRSWGTRFFGGIGVLCAAAVFDGELVAGVWREELGGEAEAVGEGLGGEQGVLAFAELGVVEVDG